MNGPSQAAFDFGDSDGSLANSAAGYFMGYSALRSSDRQLRSLCAYEARRLAGLAGGVGGSVGGVGVVGGGVGGGEGGGEGGDAAVSAGTRPKYNCSLIDCARLLIDFSAGDPRAVRDWYLVIKQ